MAKSQLEKMQMLAKKYPGITVRNMTSIQITFSYMKQSCRENIKIVPTLANIKYVVQKRGGILDKIGKDEFVYADWFPDSPRALQFSDKSTIKAKQLLSEYRKEIQKTLAHSTFLSYKKIIDNTLTSYFGDMFISSITPKCLKEFIRQQSCSDKTLRNILCPLKAVINDALDRDLIDINPFKSLPELSRIKRERKNKKGVRTRRRDPFDEMEIDEILNAMSREERNFYTVAFFSGLRPSEQIALEPSDIDLKKREIRVCKAIVKGVENQFTKTEAGFRKVKIFDDVYEALQDQLTLTRFKKSKVFMDGDKPWFDAERLRKRIWKPALDKSGVRYRHPYQTRHTYASFMLTFYEGTNIEWIADQMGHENSVMFRTSYAKIIHSLLADNGDLANKKLTELLGNKR